MVILLKKYTWNFLLDSLKESVNKCVTWKSLFMDLSRRLDVGLLSWQGLLSRVVFVSPMLTTLYLLILCHIFMCTLVYIDDLIITGNDSVVLLSFKTHLTSCFQMKDLGLLKYFLGIEVARNSKGFTFVNESIPWIFCLISTVWCKTSWISYGEKSSIGQSKGSTHLIS